MLVKLLSVSTVLIVIGITIGLQAALAQEGDDLGEVGVSSAASVETAKTGLLRDETIAVLPQIGALAFKDSQDNTGARGAIGLGFDFNLAHLDPNGPRSLFAGISTGVIYSHVGGPNANFFGDNSSLPSGLATSNVVIVPVNIKIGYAFTDRFRLGAHGGANAFYNSQPAQVQLGATSNWTVLPNVGGDVDFGVAQNTVVGLRPDVTFSSVSDFFTGTLEFGYSFS